MKKMNKSIAETVDQELTDAPATEASAPKSTQSEPSEYLHTLVPDGFEKETEEDWKAGYRWT